MVSLFDQASLAWEDGEIRKAFELFHEAANQGDKNSQLNLGYCYDEGVGTKKNQRKAMYWYKKAAQKGDLAAYTNIAIYYSSIGNFNQAKRWYLDALKRGCKDAALGLAKLGLEGKEALAGEHPGLEALAGEHPGLEALAGEHRWTRGFSR
jgi:TPR repeat protein